MKLAFSLLLLTTTALGAGSVAFAAGQGRPLALRTDTVSGAAPNAALTLVDDDGEDDGGDDDDEGGWLWSDDDDDDCDDEGDDGGDDDECAAGGTGNAAKAGTVAPPQNGLFTNGTAPVVKSN